MEDNLFKVGYAAIAAFFSYCLFAIKKASNRFDRHDVKIKEHETQIAVINEQMKHILDKLSDVVDLGTDIKKANNTILRALARKSKG